MANQRKPKKPKASEASEVYALCMLVTDGETSLPEGAPKPPPWIGDRAKHAYNTFAKVLADDGDATAQDYALLAIWCEAYEQFVEAREDTKQNGYYQKAPNSNYEQVRPQYTVARDALADMIRIAKELGLTRRSRAAIGKLSNTGDDDGMSGYVD